MMMENLYFRWNLFVCISHTRCTSHNVSPVTGAVFLSEVNIPALKKVGVNPAEFVEVLKRFIAIRVAQ